MRASFWFPEELLKMLREHSARTGVPMSETVRRAVVAYITKSK